MARGSVLDECERIPIDFATREPDRDGSYKLLTNRYWQVVDECILLYKGFSPQCNSNKSITDRLSAGVGETRFIGKVWLKCRCDR